MTRLHHLISTRLYWLAVIGLTALLLSQLLGRVVWQLELFSHYVPHVAILMLLAAIIYPNRAKSSDLYASAYQLRWVRMAFFTIAMLLLGWCLTPLFLIVPTLIASNLTAPASVTLLDHNKDDTLNIAYQNVNIANKTPEQTLKQLTQFSPEVLILIEAGGARWQSSIDQLANSYQIHCGVDDANPFAIQIFVANKATDKMTDAQPRCEILELAGYPLAKVYLADGLVIYAAHPPPPINRTLAEGRNSYLTELAALINKDKSQSILVVGDFNLSGFSPIYRHFIRDSSQNNSELHRATLLGLPTWLPLGIGIDQILVKGDSQKVISKPLGWQGSDHRGFVINWR